MDRREWARNTGCPDRGDIGRPGLRFLLGVCAVVLACWPMAGRAEGTVGQADTADLVAALQGGGLVRLAFAETLTLETSLVISADTVIDGLTAGNRRATLSGGGLRRLIRVPVGVRLELRNCVLRDGVSTNGGAILNQGILLASNVTFLACQAVGQDGANGLPGNDRLGVGGDGDHGSDGAPASGGALHNTGEAVFQHCVFTGNHATGGDGGAGGNGGTGGILNGVGGDGGQGGSAVGGAIANLGDLMVTRGYFTANSANGGSGGLGGSTNSVQRGGQGGGGAAAAGGAIHSDGILEVIQSVFATNLVTGGTSAAAGAPGVNIGKDGASGGGAVGGAIASWRQGMVLNSTFHTNVVVGGDGGDGAAGTFVVGDGGDGGDARGAALYVRGDFSVASTTFAWNGATGGAPGVAGDGGFGDDGGAGAAEGSSIFAESDSRVGVVNSILAATGVSTVGGSVGDSGYNLFTDGGTGNPATGSVTHADPVLGAFQVWGDGLPGLLPLAGSPALDSADPDRTPTVDQRGHTRPAGSGPDMGALEEAEGGLALFISGRVEHGDLGLPGIRVFLGELVVVTDAEGHFRFGPLDAGFYTVELENDGLGFSPRAAQLQLEGEPVEVVFRVAPLTLELNLNAVDGRVTLRTSGIPGREYWFEGSQDLTHWITLATVTADSQGRASATHDPGSAASYYYRLVSP